MVIDCAYIYETGRRCRRIPRRGESLCLAHNPNHRQPADEDAAFHQLMAAWGARLANIPLDQLLEALEASLDNITPVMQRKSSRRYRIDFGRALIASAIASERVHATLAASRARREGIRTRLTISKQNG